MHTAEEPLLLGLLNKRCLNQLCTSVPYVQWCSIRPMGSICQMAFQTWQLCCCGSFLHHVPAIYGLYQLLYVLFKAEKVPDATLPQKQSLGLHP